MLSVLSKLSKFSLPVIGATFLNMFASVIGVAMVSQLGREELAASALAIVSFNTLWAMSASLFAAIGILIAHQRGLKVTKKAIGSWINNGLMLSLVVGVLIGLILVNFDHYLLWFGQDPLLVSYTESYFLYAGFFMVPSLASMVCSQFFIGIGRPSVLLLVYGIRLTCAVGLFYLFVLGRFGFHSMGLGGVSFSLWLVQIIECVFLITYLALAKSTQAYGVFRWSGTLNFMRCKRIVSVGIPMGMQAGGELLVITANAYLMGFIGKVALIANQIVSQYMLLAAMIAIGLTHALAVLVSQALASNAIKLIKRYFWAAVFIIAMTSLIMLALFRWQTLWFFGMYLDVNLAENESTVSLAITLFYVSLVTLLVDGIKNLLVGMLRGLHDSTTPMILSLGSLWCIGLPASALLGFVFDFGAIGVRLGLLLGVFLALMLLYWRYRVRVSRLPMLDSSSLTT